VSLAAILGAGAMGAGSYMNYIGARHMNARNREAMRDSINQQANINREFAQNSIRWKVDDAKRAGIHPLAALGTQTHSPIISAVEPSRVNEMGRLGQDISRAGEMMMTRKGRIQNQAAKLTLERGELENELLRTQIRNANAPSLPSNADIGGLAGQGDAYMREQPARKIHSGIRAPERQYGYVSDYGFAKTRTGLTIVPSEDVKERIEDQFIPEMMWALRNQVMPYLGIAPRKPSTKEFPLPKGMEWVWSRRHMEFRPMKKNRVKFRWKN